MSGLIPVIDSEGLVTSCSYSGTGTYDLTLPNTVKTIGLFSFNQPTVQPNITTVYIPNSITQMGLGSFSKGYSKLTSVIFEAGATIESSDLYGNQHYSVGGTNDGWMPTGFKQAYKLTTLVIPTTVISLGTQFAMGCTSLPSFIIPPTVEFIDSYGFLSCTSLTSIAIPASMKFLGPDCFKNCSALTNIDFSAFSVGSALPTLSLNCFLNTGISTTNYSSVTKMYQLGYTSGQLQTAGFSSTIIELATNPPTTKSLSAIYTDYYSPAAIAANTVIPVEYQLANLTTTHTPADFKSVSFSLKQLKPFYTVLELSNGDYLNVSEYKAENVPLALMLTSFTVSDLVADNNYVDIFEYKAANVTVPYLMTAFPLQSIYQAFSLSAVISSGYLAPLEIISRLLTFTPPPSVAAMISAGAGLEYLKTAGIISSDFSTLVETTSVALLAASENKAALAVVIYNIDKVITSTDQEKTSVVLSKVSLSTLHETFLGKRTPDIVKPSAILAADPTIDADDFQDAGFQPIEIYGLYTIKDLLKSGYTSVPLFPARTMGYKLASFNNRV